MSVQALTWAFAQNISPASRKLVLIALCNRADEEGECYPSINWLSKMTSQDERTCKRALADLISTGLLTKSTRYKADGTQSSNLYRLAIGGGGQSVTLGGQLVMGEGDNLPPNTKSYKNKKITRDEFLREVDQAINDGKLNEQKIRHKLTDDLIRMSAGDAHDWWSANKFPEGDDLLAAFRGWLRRWQADLAIHQKQLETIDRNAKPAASGEASQWRMRVKGFVEKAFWLPDKWGKPPSHPGTYVPDEILSEFNIKKTELACH